MNTVRHSGTWIPLVFGLLLFSCGTADQSTNQSPPKTYPVMAMVPKKAQIVTDYPASIQGVENVEIRPKIDGYIDNIYVDEGATVKKGQLLFRINAPQYEQDVRTAEANIKIAVANVNAAKMQVDKVRPLVEQDIVSTYQLKAAQYTLESQQAALAQAGATLKNARINLSYTTISSPVDGIIGILPYKMGSLISSTTVNPLTTVSNIDRIYAYFSVNERFGLDFFSAAKGTTMQQKLATLPPVTLRLPNGMELPGKGKVETASGLINAQTGAVNMRATFANPDRLVHSGNSAIVQIPTTLNRALLIPQKATYQIQGKLFAYVLEKNHKVRSQEIQTSASTGPFYVVRQGLVAGQQVVVDGIASLRENLLIQPKVVRLDSLGNPL